MRFANISYDWPKGPKVDYPFDGPLKGLQKINAAFSLSSTMDPLNQFIVLIVGFKYCLFRIIQINITQDIISSCNLKDSRNYFGCDSQTTNHLTTTQTSNPSLSSVMATQTSSDSIHSLSTDSSDIQITDQKTDKTEDLSHSIITSDELKGTSIGIDYAEEDAEEAEVKKSSSGSMTYIIICLIIVLVIVVIICIFVGLFLRNTILNVDSIDDKIGSNAAQSKEKSSSTDTVLTIHSVTGEKVA